MLGTLMDRFKVVVVAVLVVIIVLSPNFWIKWILVVALGVTLLIMLFWNAELYGRRASSEGEIPQTRDEFEVVARMIRNARRYGTSRKLLEDYFIEAYSFMTEEDPDVLYRKLRDNPNRAIALLRSGGDFVENLKKALGVLEDDVNWEG